LEGLGAAGEDRALNAIAFKDVNQLRSVVEGRQEEAIAFNGVAGHGHSSALELLLVGVPTLNQASLGLDPLARLQSL
jgi:hypothetical protein